MFEAALFILAGIGSFGLTILVLHVIIYLDEQKSGEKKGGH